MRPEEQSASQWQDWHRAVETAGDLVYRFDLSKGTLEWLGSLESCLGLTQDEVPETLSAFLERVPQEDRMRRQMILDDHLLGQGAYDCEYRFQDGQGDYHWLHDRGALQQDGAGGHGILCGVIRRVTERKHQEARLERLACQDDLTALPNRLSLSEVLQELLDTQADQSHEGAFLVLGLDSLARINSVYGYEAGDAVLIEVTRRIQKSLRPGDSLGRIGGDRFGLILRASPEEQVRRVAQAMRDCVREAPVSIVEGELHLSASIGGVLFAEDEGHALDLMAKAESALFDAKKSGRDCISFYAVSEEHRQRVRACMETGNAVKNALTDGRLCLAYQPVVDARTHAVRFHECLARLQDAEGNLIPAAKFIPAVEQLGLMRLLDLHVLNLVLSDLERHPSITLALNISGLTAGDHDWLRTLVRRLKSRPQVARRLIVEITETAALLDVDETACFVAQVRELGSRVALDDFGAGFSTFNHLKALTVDLVKIDRSFIRDISRSPENQLFLRNLLSLARAFKLETLAEGAERGEEAAYLAREGLDMIQGYYFGMPEVAPNWRNQSGVPGLDGGHRSSSILLGGQKDLQLI
ncbi:MAG: putative bifunctional diguanylate cyclase/phosphodiesterase [Pseudomonadota bacterium]|uniref:putative bifunctional diguanylate cyclase/phosphodiesterase n=1 Tax=Fodinicurvata fenggangensis TaxID=1121830 RepID=UPI0009DE3B28|nr:GGDEF and EAL domain-containing protein [Fodinicurvata fenggangensis]